jgi:hypothetical protein
MLNASLELKVSSINITQIFCSASLPQLALPIVTWLSYLEKIKLIGIKK